MRKNKLTRIILVLLVLALCLGSCGKNDVDTEEEAANEEGTNYLVLAEGGSSPYTIVVPSGMSDGMEIADRLATSMEKVADVLIPVRNDRHETVEHEIVIGHASREKTEELFGSLTTIDDYVVCVDGKRVYLYGFSEQGVSDAISLFTAVAIDTAENGTVKIDAAFSQLHKSSKTYVTVVDGSSSEYVIACDAKHTEYAKSVQSAIKKSFGAELKIVNDASSVSKAILIGDMGTSEGKSACAELPAVFDSGVAMKEQKLVLAANFEEGLDGAVDAFTKSIKPQTFKGALVYPADYASVYDMKNDDMIPYLKMINSNSKSMKWIDCEKARIYTPDGTEDAWYYSHHTFMTEFKGKFYVVYSSGNRNEDDCRQRIMMATSDNFKDWDVKVFQDSRRGQHSDMVLYCMGIYTDGETLSVMFDTWEYGLDGLRKNPDGSDLRPEHGTGSLSNRKGPYITQSTDGVNWSEPVIMGGNIDGLLLAGNLSVFKTSTGRYIWPGFAALAYTDDPTLKNSWVGINTPLAKGEVECTLTESAVYEHANGTLFCFSRTGGGVKTIVVAASTDGGATWTDSYHTGILASGSKFQFGTLPDGRYYYLGNVDAARSNVALLISKDGINFDEWYILADDNYTMMKDGMYKGGLYGYPTSYFDENYMYVIYSLHKESVEVLRVPLAAIGVK